MFKIIRVPKLHIKSFETILIHKTFVIIIGIRVKTDVDRKFNNVVIFLQRSRIMIKVSLTLGQFSLRFLRSMPFFFHQYAYIIAYLSHAFIVDR